MALAAAALLALSGGLALPATAQAQTTCMLNTDDRWCGVVTVGMHSNGVGFTDSDGALIDNTGDQTIAIASGNYTVSSVVVLASPAGALVMGLDTRFPTGDETSLVFHIGSSTFEVSEADFTDGIGYSWLDSGLSWSVGDMVDVRLRRTTDDDAPTISVQDQTVNEGDLDPDNLLEDEGFPFQVMLSAASGELVKYKVRRVELASDTATGDDLKHEILYLEQGEIAAGETSVYLRADIILDDTLDEPDETFTLEIYDFENATAGDQTRATITIEDDDDPPSVSVADAEATEGDPAEFAVTLSAASGQTVTVGVATSIESSDTAAAGDFTAVPATTLTFMPGDTAKTVMVQTTADTTDEPDETFTLTLSSPSNVTLGDATATGTIRGDTPIVIAPPTLAATLVSNTVQISFDTNNFIRDRAQAFTTGPNAGGYNLASVGLVVDDRQDDDAAVSLCQVDNRNFPTLTCTALTAPGSSASKLRVFTAPAGTILTPSTTYAMMVESPGGDFLSLRVISDDGEDPGGAAGWTIANNYSFYSTSGVWMNTSSGNSLRIAITGAAIGGTPPRPTLSVGDAEGIEGAGTAFTVTLSEVATDEVTATWTASIESGDTAEAEDLGSTTGTVTVTANQTTATFTVPTVDDTTEEEDETFTLTLSSPSNATLAADPTATGTITDDDQGICARTPRVRDRILVLLKNRHSYKGDCSGVTETHLAKLQSLDLGRNPSTESAFTLSLKSIDFKGLVNLERLYLRETGLRSLPAGVFSGLAALDTLELDNNRLRSLPAGVFSDLLKLKTLELHRNPSLRSLPYDEFEALPNLTELLVDPEDRRGYQVAGGEGDVTLEVAAGDRTTYQVRLTHTPAYVGTANLPTLTVSSDTSGVVAAPATLRFTKENWFRRQTVTVDAPASAAGATATLSHTSVAVMYDRPIPTVTVRVLESAPGRSADPLTADFQGLPSSHDGETAFSFRLAFSEAVAVTPEAMRTHVLTVAGGAVTGAARVDGASGVWAITVTPATREALSITLAPAAECAADGAVCTLDGRALSTGAAASVIGPGPETQQPDADGGVRGPCRRRMTGRTRSASGSRLARTSGSASGRCATPAVTVDGGEVTGARRVDGRHDLWQITVEPDSDEAMTITLPGGARVRGLRGDLHPGREPQAVDQHADGDGGRPPGRAPDGGLRAEAL